MTINVDIIRHSVKYTELASAIAGLFYVYKNKNTSIKIFVVLLWYIFISESASYLIKKHSISSFAFVDATGRLYTTWIYNILETICFLVYYSIFYRALKAKKTKKIVASFALVYIFLAIINWSFYQNFLTQHQTFLFIIGALFLITSIVFYFIELLKSDNVILFNEKLLFWMSIGLLLYHSGMIPFAAEYNGYALIKGIHKLFLIVYILAMAMHTTFTIGFIWSKRD